MRVLEHRLHPAAEGKRLTFVQFGDVLAVEQRRARSRRQQSEHHSGQCRLPRSGLPGDGERGAPAQPEGHTVDRVRLDPAPRRTPGGPVGLGQVDGHEQAGCFCSIGAGSGRPQWRSGRNRGDQPVGVVVARVSQDVLRWAGFHDDAVTHDDDTFGALSGQRQVVGDEQQRGTGLRGEALQMIEYLPLHSDVECGGRLVGDQQPRPSGQSDGDEHPLAHASGQLVRVTLRLGGGVSQPRLGERLYRSPTRIS